MSSVDVRTIIKTFINANTSETVIDLSGEFSDLPDVIAEAGLTSTDPWIGLQFIGNEEIPITVGSTNTSGKYRELGAIYIHVVDIAKLGVTDSILARAEVLRDLFRGQRLGRVIIESMTPANFGDGASLNFEGGYTSASFMMAYEFDIDL